MRRSGGVAGLRIGLFVHGLGLGAPGATVCSVMDFSVLELVLRLSSDSYPRTLW